MVEIDGATVESAVNLLRSADSITVLTGAGASAESGLDTFRDPGDGLWSRYDPMQLATPEAFRADPELVTKWYDWRRCNCAQALPNAGHIALTKLQKLTNSTGRAIALLTQNVDRLHQRAGSTDVIELHGTLWVWRCLECGQEKEERGDAFAEFPSVCTCGGLRRPAVVWFGEPLDETVMARSRAATESCDVFISVGTSALVYPAAGFVELARSKGASTIEVNLAPTPASGRIDVSIAGPSGQILPLLLDALDRCWT